MRKLLLIFLCCFSLAGYADQVFHDSNGKKLQMSQLKNKWIIVNYWAGWCGTCVGEIPELNHFYNITKNKNVVLYGVNYDGLTGKELKNTISRFRIAFPILVEDPKSAWKLSESSVLPTTFIINPKGKVVKKIEGPTNSQALMAIINRSA